MSPPRVCAPGWGTGFLARLTVPGECRLVLEDLDDVDALLDHGAVLELALAVDLVGEEILDVVSEGDLIEKGRKVRIIGNSGHEAVVEAV